MQKLTVMGEQSLPTRPVTSWTRTPIEAKSAAPATEFAVCVWSQHKLAGPELLPPEVGVATAKTGRASVVKMASLENMVALL